MLLLAHGAFAPLVGTLNASTVNLPLVTTIHRLSPGKLTLEGRSPTSSPRAGSRRCAARCCPRRRRATGDADASAWIVSRLRADLGRPAEERRRRRSPWRSRPTRKRAHGGRDAEAGVTLEGKEPSSCSALPIGSPRAPRERKAARHSPPGGAPFSFRADAPQSSSRNSHAACRTQPSRCRPRSSVSCLDLRSSVFAPSSDWPASNPPASADPSPPPHASRPRAPSRAASTDRFRRLRRRRRCAKVNGSCPPCERGAHSLGVLRVLPPSAATSHSKTTGRPHAAAYENRAPA